MARCTAKWISNERHRWETMSERSLFQRLQAITKPEKLACFLHIAASESRGTLFRDGIDRCNALGFAAIEENPGWYNVVAIDRPEPPMYFTEQGYGSKSILTEEVMKQVEEDIEKPKKKKSLYSRKLRTKRRG